MRLLLYVALLSTLAANAADVQQDIRWLSDAKLEGRKTGTAGAQLARDYLAQRYQQLGLHYFNGSFSQPFSYGRSKTGINMVGYLPGCTYPKHYIAVTAHYDHLGKQGHKIFHGADDNASGVAVMLEMASRLSQRCPAYSYIFIATDAEEGGLYGSKAFVGAPPVALNNIVLNLNLDMLGRPDRRGRLYLTGAKRFPDLIATLAPRFNKLQFLHHRGPGRLPRAHSRYDWPNASDHGPFHRAGISYLFFGGQDHAHYHTELDTWQRINSEFLSMAIDVVWVSVNWLEQQPPQTLLRQPEQ
ncbi:M28 family peptidase [Rheinheimera fenheensis]|uniref:M28 family peptidase n=1 Tax=Rheinheimera fenheensis TaxID=3152295 RepID=UPI003261889E